LFGLGDIVFQTVFLGLNWHFRPERVSRGGPAGFLKPSGKGIVLEPQDLPPMRRIRLDKTHTLNGIILQPLDLMGLRRIPLSTKDFAILLRLHIRIHIPIVGSHVGFDFLHKTRHNPRLHYSNETFKGTSCNRSVLVAERESS
jgi:hypothetical protein